MPGFASLLVASAAVRAASLNLCTDEYLLLLAHPAEIASVSRLSHDPADSPLWRVGRRFPANRGTLESALPSRPTLILTMGGGGRATGAIARTIGVRTLDLPYPATIADVETNMVRVATALGDARRATPWANRLAQLRPPARQRDTIFLSGGGNSIGAGSLGAQWMRLAGFGQRPLAGGRATLEQLATNPPAVILRSNYRRAQVSLGQRWLDHPLARRAASRRVDTDGRAWTCSGPIMLQEIERLRGIQ